MSNRRRFTTEYKEEIIKLVTEHGENAFPGSGNLRPEDEEIRKMKKMMANLQEENEILHQRWAEPKKLYAS